MMWAKMCSRWAPCDRPTQVSRHAANNTVPYHTLPYPTLPYPTLPYPTQVCCGPSTCTLYLAVVGPCLCASRVTAPGRRQWERWQLSCYGSQTVLKNTDFCNRLQIRRLYA